MRLSSASTGRRNESVGLVYPLSRNTHAYPNNAHNRCEESVPRPVPLSSRREGDAVRCLANFHSLASLDVLPDCSHAREGRLTNGFTRTTPA